MPIKHSGLDRFIIVLNVIFLTLAVLIIVLPLIYVVIASYYSDLTVCRKAHNFNHRCNLGSMEHKRYPTNAQSPCVEPDSSSVHDMLICRYMI
ncbi:hypothetical protein [Paenibacillus sp. sgz500958]|uniref:hypothetical protein n=1 Tax=Paenibacillus sp. sgz500958 TaxID=3242475 RepID=UPI0036D41506